MATWILVVLWLSRLILVLLVGLSVWSVAIMIERRRVFRGLADEAAVLERTKNQLRQGTYAAVSVSDGGAEPTHPGLRSLAQAARLSPQASADQAERAFRGALTEARPELERGLGVLATLGSNAPFLGLLGTVLGIIQAFGELASESGNTAAVMASISEALVATAVGLFVAIPAVVAYNAYTRRLKGVLTESEVLLNLYLAGRGSGRD